MPLDALVTGRIATFAGPAGFGWVEAVGIKDGLVAFAGSAIELETRADPHTLRYDLEPGEIAVPGLIDAHLHLIDAALEAERVDLTACATLEDGLAEIARYAATLGPGDWLEGAGWDQRRWGRWPAAADLERVAGGRPVALWSFDHHALWVSPAALAAAGIGDATPDPDGGIIRRDAAGRPEGVLLENATRLVNRVIPPATEVTLERAIGAMGRSLLSLGVVGVHDPGFLIPDAELRMHAMLGRMADRGTLPIRVHAGIRADALETALERGVRSGTRLGQAAAGDVPDRARVGWLKLFADGTLGSRTAALLDPIGGLPPDPAAGDHGVFTTPPERLRELAARAADGGIATQIHAIGDAAVRASLDALEPTAARVPVMPRLEHIQLCHPADRPRFAAGGIAASVQPVHVREDAATAIRDWGERAEAWGYTWRSLLDADAVVAFGTDAPVEPIDPWPGIAMAVLRRWPGWPAEQPVFGAHETLTLDQALRAASIGPAAAAREQRRGRLLPGAPADLIVLPAAPREPAAEAAAFANVHPRLVIVDGVAVVER
ncbi:MAG TPA: amidohydrolase [Candidatus Acidoferrales bacterium]|nr:amidohydrolase [Candidatus Acidoferrales bacterium]